MSKNNEQPCGDEFVKKLRKYANTEYVECPKDALSGGLILEAADHIERQQAEIERLTGKLKAIEKSYNQIVSDNDDGPTYNAGPTLISI